MTLADEAITGTRIPKVRFGPAAEPADARRGHAATRTPRPAPAIAATRSATRAALPIRTRTQPRATARPFAAPARATQGRAQSALAHARTPLVDESEVQQLEGEQAEDDDGRVCGKHRRCRGSRRAPRWLRRLSPATRARFAAARAGVRPIRARGRRRSAPSGLRSPADRDSLRRAMVLASSSSPLMKSTARARRGTSRATGAAARRRAAPARARRPASLRSR